jgi:predicted dithiol-disulfide oxidoreductase (DUF899 family)
MEHSGLSESDEYRAARERLRLAEVALTDHLERVAALRRELPLGPVVQDYSFLEVAQGDGAFEQREVTLSELLTSPARSLIVYHLMFGKRQSSPCPMCTMWVDGFNGLAVHVRERAQLVIVAAAEATALRAHVVDRGWTNVRVLSAAENSFKRDLGSEDADGNQFSMITVLRRDRDEVRLFYSARPQLTEDRFERGIDLLCSTWHLFDLTPEARGDWYASLEY